MIKEPFIIVKDACNIKCNLVVISLRKIVKVSMSKFILYPFLYVLVIDCQTSNVWKKFYAKKVANFSLVVYVKERAYSLVTVQVFFFLNKIVLRLWKKNLFWRRKVRRFNIKNVEKVQFIDKDDEILKKKHKLW